MFSKMSGFINRDRHKNGILIVFTKKNLSNDQINLSITNYFQLE